MQPAAEGFRFNLVSYLVLFLLAVVWPVSSFVFLGSQLNLLKDIADPITDLYYPTIAVQLLTLALVVIATRSERVNLADIGLHRFTRWTVLQGVVFLIAANMLLYLLQVAISVESPGSFSEITAIIPKTTYARLVWVILCAIVAVSEEMAFRGYILTRVTRIAGGRSWVGVLVATIAFASGHLYQGLGGFAVIFVYGLMFAGLYLYTGSLLPGMVAHFLQDAMLLLVPDLTR
jgi:uncharacterized protein